MSGNKIRQSRIMTAVVGSYPKPDYLYPGDARKILDDCGRSFLEFRQKIGKPEFRERVDRASIMAIADHAAYRHPLKLTHSMSSFLPNCTMLKPT
jgi:hypothetical protein